MLWFPLSFFPIVVYSFFFFVRGERKYIYETFFSLAILISGCIRFMGYDWLHLVYVPCLIALSVVYRPDVIFRLGLAVPVVEIRHFIRGNIAGEIFFCAVTILAPVISSSAFSRLKDERDKFRQSLETIKEEAENIDYNSAPKAINDESLASQHLSSTIKANEEICDILLIVKTLLLSDSTTMYVPHGNGFSLRCSTGPSDMEPYDADIFELCKKEKRPIISESASLIAAPLMDGSFVAGVVAARSRKAGAFKMSGMKVIEMLSAQIVKLLRRERIDSQMKREHAGLKILHENSSGLVTSLKTEVIAQKLLEASYKIAPLPMAFFMSRGEKFELLHQIGLVAPDERHFDIRNTLVGTAHRNREPFYFSDLRDNRMPVLPFKTGNVNSVFILPLIYEKEFLGITAFLSEKANALSSYQIELLEVLGNQASTSLANAEFHSEIEKMALTDGLTGLFNHRHFQEKLSAELRRAQRFSDNLPFAVITCPL